MQVVKGYVRDPITKAVINKDEKDYKDHIFKMDIYKEINDLKNQVSFLQEELRKIQGLLANSEEKQ